MNTPIIWSFRYDVIQKKGNMIEPANSFKTLISTLLNSLGQNVMEANALDYFVTPGGLGEVVVSFKKDSFEKLKKTSIENLNLKIEYTFTRD